MRFKKNLTALELTMVVVVVVMAAAVTAVTTAVLVIIVASAVALSASVSTTEAATVSHVSGNAKGLLVEFLFGLPVRSVASAFGLFG